MFATDDDKKDAAFTAFDDNDGDIKCRCWYDSEVKRFFLISVRHISLTLISTQPLYVIPFIPV